MTLRIVLTLMLLLPAGAALAQPGYEELERRMLAGLVAPAMEYAEQMGWDGAFAIRVERGSVNPASLADALGSHLHRQGIKTYVLLGRQEPADDALLLEITPHAVSLSYGEPKRSFFGLGSARVERRATLIADIRLVDPKTGELLMEARPEQRHVDSIPAELQVALVSGDALHVTGGGSRDGDPNALRPKGPGWIERGVAAGLLGGIVILYFSGAS